MTGDAIREKQMQRTVMDILYEHSELNWSDCDYVTGKIVTKLLSPPEVPNDPISHAEKAMADAGAFDVPSEPAPAAFQVGDVVQYERNKWPPLRGGIKPRDVRVVREVGSHVDGRTTLEFEDDIGWYDCSEFVLVHRPTRTFSEEQLRDAVTATRWIYKENPYVISATDAVLRQLGLTERPGP